MTQDAVISLLIAGGMSVVTGVLTWWITRSRERLDEKRRMKRELLTQLHGNRFDLKGDEFSRALNASAVVFADSPRVRDAIRLFHAEVSAPDKDPVEVQRTLLAMIRVMFDDLELRHGDLTDEFLLKPFNTRIAPPEPWSRPLRLVKKSEVGPRPVLLPQNAPAIWGTGLNSFTCPSCGLELLSKLPPNFQLQTVLECPRCHALGELA